MGKGKDINPQAAGCGVVWYRPSPCCRVQLSLVPSSWLLGVMNAPSSHPQTKENDDKKPFLHSIIYLLKQKGPAPPSRCQDAGFLPHRAAGAVAGRSSGSPGLCAAGLGTQRQRGRAARPSGPTKCLRLPFFVGWSSGGLQPLCWVCRSPAGCAQRRRAVAAVLRHSRERWHLGMLQNGKFWKKKGTEMMRQQCQGSRKRREHHLKSRAYWCWRNKSLCLLI